MKGLLIAGLAALALAVDVPAARAQFPARTGGYTNPAFRPGGYTSPAFSPYLNLARRGNPAFLNYYGLVRPEIEFRTQIQGLQQQVTDVTTGLDGQAAGLPTTGHPVQFLNYGQYFGTLTRGGAGPGRPAITTGFTSPQAFPGRGKR